MASDNSRGHPLYSEVPEETYLQIKAIAIRRGETLRMTVSKALTSYIATDKRTQRRRRHG